MGTAEQGTDFPIGVASAGYALLKRLLLWIEKEAHLMGVDIEVEITSIISKLERKQKR